jgi:hypothetical protein
MSSLRTILPPFEGLTYLAVALIVGVGSLSVAAYLVLEGTQRSRATAGAHVRATRIHIVMGRSGAWAGPEFQWTVDWENLMKEKSHVHRTQTRFWAAKGARSLLS